MNFELTPVQWHCANCGALVMGMRNSDGIVKARCPKCQAVMVSKQMGRRHDRIDIYAPPGEMRMAASI